jgi:hypothetical protein
MSNIVIVTPIADGSLRTILHVYVKSDGVSGDLVDYVIADPADYGMSGDSRFFTVESIQSGLNGFSATLKFDYLLSGTLIWAVPEFHSEYDFKSHGGLKDRTEALDGTGKVLLSTNGLGEGDEGSFIISLKK